MLGKNEVGTADKKNTADIFATHTKERRRRESNVQWTYQQKKKQWKAKFENFLNFE